MKLCRSCNHFLPESAFTVRSLSPDGLSYKCRSCAGAYARQRYKLKSVRDVLKARAKRWAAEHPEKRKEIVKKSAKKHRQKKALANKIQVQRRRRLFPEIVRLQGRIASQKRRVRFDAAGEMPPLEVIELILKAARGRCVYCGDTKAPLTLDHFTPVSDSGGNAWSNFVPCCKSCNSSKNDLDGADWLYDCHGAVGLANTLVFMKSVAKAIKRLHPKLYRDFCNQIVKQMGAE